MSADSSTPRIPPRFDPRFEANVSKTFDDEFDAGLYAARLQRLGHRVGVLETRLWNELHPDRIAKTANRWVVYTERRR